MGNFHTNINRFKGRPSSNSSHNPLIANNELYNAVYDVNPTAANNFATGITYIINGFQNLGVSRSDAESAIYYLEDYIAQGVFGQNSYTNPYGNTYYGPQSTNFNPNTYSAAAKNWTPYSNYSDIVRMDT
jgi:hypothetical protein